MPAAEAAPILPDEAARLLAGWQDIPSLLIAVSGGPDSLALLWLARQWRMARSAGPRLFIATVDHGLRAEAASEAWMVARLCRQLDLPHQTLRWAGPAPASGLQAAAREARYGLLAAHAEMLGVRHLALAHHQDDQAETVLMRLSAGSGIAGLGGMAPVSYRGELTVLRPLLDLPKLRLMATCRAAGLSPVEDPGNASTDYARGRLRGAADVLADEGLNAERLGRLAQRMQRAEAALDAIAAETSARVWRDGVMDNAAFDALQTEIALRVLARGLGQAGAGPLSLVRLEALCAALHRAGAPVTRTLGGVLVRRGGTFTRVSMAPPRQRRSPPSPKSETQQLSAAPSLGKGGEGA